MTTCTNCGHTSKPSAAPHVLERAAGRLKRFKAGRGQIADETFHFWVLAALCAIEELDARSAQ